MIVTFTPETTDLNYVDSENINLIISWGVSLTPEELLEPEPNTIVSKTANISPSTTNISYPLHHRICRHPTDGKRYCHQSLHALLRRLKSV